MSEANLTNHGANASSDISPEEVSFPPKDLASFLRHCAGDWLSLRSRFNLGSQGDNPGESSVGELSPAGHDSPQANDGDDNNWHASERAELSVTLLAAKGDGHGGLALAVKGQPGQQRAYFHADGSFGPVPEASQGVTGQWALGPDGSLDLMIEADGRRVKERIWFTKPNLRLRSTVEQLAGESPGRASFSSEIRRVPKPPASSSTGPAPKPGPSPAAN